MIVRQRRVIICKLAGEKCREQGIGNWERGNSLSCIPSPKIGTSTPRTKTCLWGSRDLHPTDEDLSVGTPGPPPHGRRPVRGDPGTWGTRLVGVRGIPPFSQRARKGWGTGPFGVLCLDDQVVVGAG